MRIITGGMNHESNSLNPIITGADDFVVQYGDEFFDFARTHGDSPAAGIIAALQAAGAQVIPTVFARAVPNGVVSGAFYRTIKEQFLSRIKTALNTGPVDGICLALHGSMKVEGIGCAEGDLVKAIRAIAPDIPFTAALDMHATITPELLSCVDGFAGYKTAPHVDTRETGEHAARLLLESLKLGRKLKTAYRRVPMLVAGEKSESEAEPMRGLISLCREAEKKDGILAASYLLGFPWADCEDNAVSVLVTSFADNKEAAEKCADNLQKAFWEKRADFRFSVEHYNSLESIKKAYSAVLDEGQSPVFVSDSGDNPTAGAAGDATEFFEKILETADTADKLPTPLLYSGFYDEAAARAACSAGTGAVLDLTLGGNWDKANGKQIPLRVKVESIFRAYGSYKSDLALLSYKNIRIVVTSKHIGFGDDELLAALKVNAKDYCVVCVKLGYLEPCFKNIAARAIMATSKGCSNELLETIPYKKVRRPLYPLDNNFYL